MKHRCLKDPKYVANKITVCARWQSFEAFYSDMGDLPTPKHTLDRIDGAKGYSPDNCRWATYTEQNRNLRSNVRVGSQTLAEIAQRIGMAHNTVRYRAMRGLDVFAPPIQERTTCKAGHEWTDKNTYIANVKRKQGGTRIQRYCRICRALAQQTLRDRRKKV